MDSEKFLEEKYGEKLKALQSKRKLVIEEFENESKLFSKQTQVVCNTKEILDDLDLQFQEKTGLNNTDITFLFLAVGLQIARQYLLSNEKFRKTATQGDKMVGNALSLAPPNVKDVLTQSVPYDAIKTGEHVSNTGLAGTTHRYRTLGHDPVLGWVFGTANIMTNSLTKTNLETYQVKQNTIIRHYPAGVSGMMNRATKYATENPSLLAVSVARQAVHFGSDYFTKQGLPFPGVSMIDDELAKNMLTKWHVDMYSITRGATLAAFINLLISMIHRLFFDGDTEMDRKLYEVKTRKIISYSNLIATSSNIAVVAITKKFDKLDIGGIAVCIYELIRNKKFIREVKEEFLFGEFKKAFLTGEI